MDPLILFWLLPIGLVMLPRLLNLNVFIGPDELAIWGWGNRFAQVLAQGDWGNTLIGDGYPAVTVMWTHTIGITLKWLWLQVTGVGISFEQVIGLDRPLELYAERRMFLAFVNGLQILATYPLLKKIWNRQVAILAVIFMAIEPFSLAFTRMIRADALLSGFMLLSILASLVFLKTDNARYNGLAGAMGGLAALSKSSGGIMAPTMIVVYSVVAWYRFQQSQPTLRWLVKAILTWGIASAIIFFGLWPAWWTQPADTFNLLWDKLMFHTVEAVESRASIYFWGTVHPDGPGMWFYPVLALLRLTPWLLLGGLFAIGHWLWQAIRSRSATTEPYSLAIIFYLAAYWLVITIPGQKFDRFLLPIIPGLAVLTAIEVVNIANRLKFRLRRRWLRPAAAAMITLLVLHVSFYHPLYSTYFDPLVGGPQFWQWALPIGHGEGVDEALIHLSTQPDTADKTIVCGTNFPRCQPFFAGEVWHQKDLRSTRWFEANYALWHIDEQQMELFSTGVLNYLRRQPQIYVAKYHDVAYTWLYAVPQPAFLTGGSKLEGIATLLGYDIANQKNLTTLSPGDELSLHLYWQNEEQIALHRFWWRIVDNQGYVWREAEVHPLPAFEAEAVQDEAVVEGQVILTLPPDMPPNTYYLKAGFADANGDVGEFVLPPASSVLNVAGPSVGAATPANIVNETLTPNIILQGYDLSSQQVAPDEVVWLVLYWQTLDRPQDDYVIVLQLHNESGEEITSWTGRPVYNTYPTLQWPAQTNIRDPWPLSLPPNLPPGHYQLSLDLLNAATESLASTDLTTIEVVERRVNFDIPAMQFETDQLFGNVAQLRGYDLSGDLLPDGTRVKVTLYWQAQQATGLPHTVNLRLVNPAGTLLAEQESQPAAGLVPTTGWQPDEIITDLHEMNITGKQATQANLEIRLLDSTGQSILLPDGAETFVVPDVQQKVIWRTSTP